MIAGFLNFMLLKSIPFDGEKPFSNHYKKDASRSLSDNCQLWSYFG